MLNNNCYILVITTIKNVNWSLVFFFTAILKFFSRYKSNIKWVKHTKVIQKNIFLKIFIKKQF